jgi:hypothetical protein
MCLNEIKRLKKESIHKDASSKEVQLTSVAIVIQVLQEEWFGIDYIMIMMIYIQKDRK